jgi:hypothetical protein
MDVQATATAAVFSPPSYTPPASTSGATTPGLPPPAPSVPVISGTDSGSQNSAGAYSGSSSNATIGETPGLATLPAGPPDGSKKSASDASLASGVAKLYNAQEQNVAVSFQVEQNPNEIVTVFTDKTTGKVIVQFPSETLIALAKFFDKLDGTVVNKKV